MTLRPENERITVSGADAVKIFREIELVVTSLHKIGAYYAVAPDSEKMDYERETTRFIDAWNVTSRLAEARGILSKCFDLSLGEDEMDDLERVSESVDYWSGPKSLPPRR